MHNQWAIKSVLSRDSDMNRREPKATNTHSLEDLNLIVVNIILKEMSRAEEKENNRERKES